MPLSNEKSFLQSRGTFTVSLSHALPPTCMHAHGKDCTTCAMLKTVGGIKL